VIFAAGGLSSSLSAAGAVGLQGANQRGGAIGDAVRPSVWREVMDTRFGHSWGIRAGLALALVILVSFARRAGPALHHPHRS